MSEKAWEEGFYLHHLKSFLKQWLKEFSFQLKFTLKDAKAPRV